MAATRDVTLRVGIGVGFAMVLLGIAAYVLSDFASLTALIPAILGIVFVTVGRVGLNMNRERQAVYGLGVLSVLGIAGSARGFGDVLALVTGGTVDNTIGAVSMGLMILLSLVVLVVVVWDLVASQ